MRDINVTQAKFLWSDGVKIDDMCQMLGTTPRTLLRLRQDMPDVFPDRKSAYASSMSPSDIKEASEMWANGVISPAIAKHFSVSPGVISGMMARNRELFPERYGDRNKKNKTSTISGKPKLSNGEAAREKRSANSVRKLAFEFSSSPIPKPKEQYAEYDRSRLPYAVTLADLDVKNCCSWSVTENPKGVPNLMCAEVKASKRYCQAHEARAWRVK